MEKVVRVVENNNSNRQPKIIEVNSHMKSKGYRIKDAFVEERNDCNTTYVLLFSRVG